MYEIERWDAAFDNHLHVVCGFHTNCPDNVYGWVLAKYLVGDMFDEPWPHTIRDAWEETTRLCVADNDYIAAIYYVRDFDRNWKYKDEFLPRYENSMYPDPDLSDYTRYALEYRRWNCRG